MEHINLSNLRFALDLDLLRENRLRGGSLFELLSLEVLGLVLESLGLVQSFHSVVFADRDG